MPFMFGFKGPVESTHYSLAAEALKQGKPEEFRTHLEYVVKEYEGDIPPAERKFVVALAAQGGVDFESLSRDVMAKEAAEQQRIDNVCARIDRGEITIEEVLAGKGKK